jgi:hypothetical protein
MISSPRRSFVAALIIISVVMGGEESAVAWEGDVHYGLTYWLARRAGFSPEDAQLVAAGDLSADQGRYRSAPWAVALHIILGGDLEASKAVQEWHFPSYATLPARPDQRRVEPNSSAARHLALKEIDSVDLTVPRQLVLEEFGRSLHPLQDSWSHQGIPDIPFGIRPDLSWGHPKDRGGWRSHTADITCHHDPGETLGVARATFKLMLKFRSTHQMRSSSTPSEWEELVPRVEAFAQACSKQAKLQWFQSEAPEFGGWSPVLKRINLRGHLDRAPMHLATPFDILPPAPQDFREALTTFLTKWLVERDIPAALQFVSIADVANQLSASKGASAGEEEASLWAQKFLTLWLIEDHGLVNELGHGIPAADGYVKLPKSTRELSDEFRLLRYEKLADAFEVPQGPSMEDATPFSIVEVSPDLLSRNAPDLQLQGLTAPLYAVLFNFVEFPHDTLILLTERKSNSWRIIRMDWVVL